MATQIPTSYKYCANCIYWEGSRDINPNLHQTTIYDSNKKKKSSRKPVNRGKTRILQFLGMT